VNSAWRGNGVAWRPKIMPGYSCTLDSMDEVMCWAIARILVVMVIDVNAIYQSAI